jgi:23S rRNA (cytosine1962-C5)-methyltransferase
VDEPFFARRLAAAVDLRTRAFGDERFVRLVHGEADLLPGLVVDRYGDVAVLQTLIPATDRRKAFLAELVANTLGLRSILERNDVRVRELEGLSQTKGVLRGADPGPVEYREGAVRMRIDLLAGQKTGLARRAERVTAVEMQPTAAALLRENAALNRAENLDVVEANAFDWLRDRSEEEPAFDLVVLDPPAFAKNKKSLPGARRGYKEINLRAIKLLSPGGVLLTCSCSYHVDEALLVEIVAEAARDAGAVLALVEKRMQSRDHPVLVGVPETWYLKCLVLRRVS